MNSLSKCFFLLFVVPAKYSGCTDYIITGCIWSGKLLGKLVLILQKLWVPREACDPCISGLNKLEHLLMRSEGPEVPRSDNSFSLVDPSLKMT